MNETVKLFGKRLRKIRRIAKLTLEKAAEKAGLSAKFIGEIERGEKRPSFDAILALAKALNVPAKLFFYYDGEEMDAQVLRRRIDTILAGCSTQQLQQAYRVLKAVVDP
jgi:transcriptional regulator with XRE-family HTH domain